VHTSVIETLNTSPFTIMSKESVLIFGLGGIGGIYACILALGGQCDVHVVARSNYESVKKNGFRLVSTKFGDHDDIQFAGGELASSYVCMLLFA
jgi:lactate dehydrogenase-like 2-hydroxyacid dehydrogenase